MLVLLHWVNAFLLMLAPLVVWARVVVSALLYGLSLLPLLDWCCIRVSQPLLGSCR